MFGASKAIKQCQPVHSNQSQHVDETLQIPPKTHLQRKAKRLHGKTEYLTVILAGLEKLPRLVCRRIYLKHLKGPCLLSSLLANHLNIASSDLQLGTRMPIANVLHVRPLVSLISQCNCRMLCQG